MVSITNVAFVFFAAVSSCEPKQKRMKNKGLSMCQLVLSKPFLAWDRFRSVIHWHIGARIMFAYSSLLQESNHKGDRWDQTGATMVSPKNPSIYNIIRWVAWTMGQTNRRPSVWCSKYYFFSWFLAKFFAKILSIYFLIFFIKLQK